MKKNDITRLLSVLLSFSLVMGTSNFAYAAEAATEVRQPTNISSIENTEIDLTTADNPIMIGDRINTALLTSIGQYSELSAEEKRKSV